MVLITIKDCSKKRTSLSQRGSLAGRVNTTRKLSSTKAYTVRGERVMFIERHAEGNYKTKHTQRRRHQAKEVKKED